MLQIEKVFEKVSAYNHSIDSYFDNKIRIKDKRFSIKSIYKIVQHIKWMKFDANLRETKILIDSDYISDQAILTLFESIIYFVINEWNINIVYRFKLNENTVGYEIFKRSMLYKFNNKKISINEYNKEYNRKITIEGEHFRKICENTEENRKEKFLSITMDEIDIFLKLFGLDEEYRSELAEAVIEIIDNALKHSKGDCILCINVLENKFHKYQYIDVAVIVVDDIFIGKGIIEYIDAADKSEYSSKNEVVIKAYENHKNYFNEKYNLNLFAMISAFQKYVTTRKIGNSGGTGLTTLVKALIEKSTLDCCYAISGKSNLIFKKNFLNLNEEGLIGFNKENNYIELIPDEDVVNINQYDMNVNIYNLQFILKENKDGK